MYDVSLPGSFLLPRMYNVDEHEHLYNGSRSVVMANENYYLDLDRRLHCLWIDIAVVLLLVLKMQESLRGIASFVYSRLLDLNTSKGYMHDKRKDS